MDTLFNHPVLNFAPPPPPPPPDPSGGEGTVLVASVGGFVVASVGGSVPGRNASAVQEKKGSFTLYDRTILQFSLSL